MALNFAKAARPSVNGREPRLGREGFAFAMNGSLASRRPLVSPLGGRGPFA